MARLAVVLMTDRSDPVKVENAIQFTLIAHDRDKLEDLRFYLLGTSVRLPGQVLDDIHLRTVFGELQSSPVPVVACSANAYALNEDETLARLGITTRDIGTELVDLVADGYQVMTF